MRQSPSPPPGPRQTPHVAACFAQWAARPLRENNRRAVVWTGLAMAWIVTASRSHPDQVKIIRDIAMVCIGGHGFLHVALLSIFEHFRTKGVVEADTALRAYRAPRRITHLDLAMAWGLLAILVSLYRSLVPVAT